MAKLYFFHAALIIEKGKRLTVVNMYLVNNSIFCNYLEQGTLDERPNIGYDSEKVKKFGPQTGFEPTPLEEMSFQVESSTTEL